jgi:hypothetical protein
MSDPSIIEKIVLGLIKRIGSFQSRRIFYPDELVLQGLT